MKLFKKNRIAKIRIAGFEGRESREYEGRTQGAAPQKMTGRKGPEDIKESKAPTKSMGNVKGGRTGEKKVGRIQLTKKTGLRSRRENKDSASQQIARGGGRDKAQTKRVFVGIRAKSSKKRKRQREGHRLSIL